MIEIVAEISCNHNNSLIILDQILDELLTSEFVSCIKLQAFQAASCTSKERGFHLTSGPWAGNSLFELMTRAETSLELIEHAASRTKAAGKKLMLSINAIEDLYLIEHLHPAYIKLPSPESLDIILAKKILNEHYNLVISTGVMDDDELVVTYGELLPSLTSNGSLTILHCISDYPTSMEEVNLNRLDLIKEIAPGAAVGISDHTLGDFVPIIATGFGISMIEKHVMPSHENFKSLDSSFSMTTCQFLAMAERVYKANTVLGNKRLNRNCRELYCHNRISAHAKHQLEIGHTLSFDDFVMYRPGDGISPLEVNQFVGRKILRQIEKGRPIRGSDVT